VEGFLERESGVHANPRAGDVELRVNHPGQVDPYVDVGALALPLPYVVASLFRQMFRPGDQQVEEVMVGEGEPQVGRNQLFECFVGTDGLGYALARSKVEKCGSSVERCF
jgi:hypothetical protein